MNWSNYFIYDEASPSGLRWKYGSGCMKSGGVAGNLEPKGYWRVMLESKRYYTHRIIWEMFFGEIPEEMFIDHINQNKSDNRPSNFRVVTDAVNKRNRSKCKSNSSGVTGVGWVQMGERIYWYASWSLDNGKRKSAYYSIDDLGDEEAFRLSCERRTSEIENRNKQGAGYTEAHGL